MKLSSLILMFFFASFGKAQLLSWSPSFIQESSSSIDIICDATLGNTGIKDYTPTSDIYVHIGAITTSSTNGDDWRGVPFTWATTPSVGISTFFENEKWGFNNYRRSLLISQQREVI